MFIFIMFNDSAFSGSSDTFDITIQSSLMYKDVTFKTHIVTISGLWIK